MTKNLIKNSFYYTILGFLPLSFAFIFTPIYLTYLNESEYGTLNLFVLYSGFLVKIYGLGIPNAFNFFYWDVYKDKNKLDALISSVLGLLISLQIVFILLGLFFGKSILAFLIKSSDKFTDNPIFISALLFSAFMVYYEMFLYFFRNRANLKSYAILSVSTLIMLTLGTFTGVVVFDLKAVGAILGRTFGYGVVISCFLIYFIFKHGITINFSKSKELFSFGIPLFINALIGALCYGIDRIIIERFDTLENVGIYSFALVIISLIETCFTALNNALSPTLFRLIKESLHDKVDEIKTLSQTIIIVITFLIAIIVALVHPLFEFIIPENYQGAATYIPILAFAFMWRVFTSLYTYPFYIKKQTRYLLLNQSINLIVTVALGYWGYRMFGITGVVMALYIVKIIEFVIIYLISKKIMDLPFEIKKYIVLAFLMGICSFIITYLDNTLNKYLTYCIPLLILFITTPILLKKEIMSLFQSFKLKKII